MIPKCYRAKILYLACMIAWPGMLAAEVVWEMESAGDFEYALDREELESAERTTIRYIDGTNAPVVLTANRLWWNRRSGEARAAGAVVLEQSGQRWVGEQLDYNFTTGEARTGSFRTGYPPVFAAGQGLSLDPTNQTYVATNAIVTTDDVGAPGVKIRAREIRMVPGKYIQARHATVLLGKVPLFYFPYYRRPLDTQANYWELAPGYRSAYGPFLLTKYNWQASDRLELGMRLDYRLERGLGVGPEAEYDLGRWGKGGLQLYYLDDQEPGEDSAGQPIDNDRYRFRFQHQIELRTNLTVRAAVHRQSDEFVLHDLFEREYRRDMQPRTYVEGQWIAGDFSLSAMAQAQINDFFETVERLPDVRLTGMRQRLGISPIYYESESSLGYFRRQYADDALPRYEAMRADTFQQLVLPRTLFGWLNVTPRAGGRLTYYGEADGPGGVTEEETRGVFNTGAEASAKVSRLWKGARSRFWEMNGLRHIAEPSIQYVYVPNPSEAPARLPQFDYEVPTYRLLPIEYPDYNAIDSIDSQNALRFELYNRLQTKRGEEIDHLLAWGLATDWRLNPRPGQATMADLYSDLDFKPRTWITLSSEVRYDLEIGRLRLASHRLTLRPNDTWSLSLGQRYLRDEPSLGADYAIGNNLIYGRIFYKLNENWAFSVAEHFEARNGLLQEQYYTVYRDFRSWTGALTFRLREQQDGEEDFSVAAMFSLKAFPRFNLGQDSDNPGSLLGY